MARTFPRTIYVRWEGESNEPYLVADASFAEHAQAGEKVRVATYELKAEGDVTATPTIANKPGGSRAK